MSRPHPFSSPRPQGADTVSDTPPSAPGGPGTDRAGIREFFGARAATWDTRFPDDTPAYEAAVAQLDLAPGGAALDAGCGTGRALAALRAAVGPSGVVVGTDLTPQMLHAAAAAGRHCSALLAEADAGRLPVRSGVLDAVFAAGLLHHLPDPAAGLREFARVARPGARLALFHPIGRAALAARRGHVLGPDDVRAEANLRPLLAATGWQLARCDDGDERYLALAVRLPDRG